MPVFANFPRQTIDLMDISPLVFRNVSGLLKVDRERAAKEIIQKYSNSEIMLVIAHLTHVFFNMNIAWNIPVNYRSFLDDILQAYVNKYDGVRLYQAYQDKNLENFKFSRQSTEIFSILASIARDKSDAKKDLDFEESLASNLSIKVWQRIITLQAPKLTVQLARDMQDMGKSTDLLNQILKNNVNLNTTYDLSAALEQLEQTAATIDNEDVIAKTKIVIQKIQELAIEDPNSESLFWAIESTTQLLNKNIQINEYQTRLQTMQGANSPGLKTLAIAMWALALAAATAGLCLTTAGAIPLAMGVTSLAFSVAGGGFFAAHKSSGLAKCLENTAQAVNTYENGLN